MNNAAHIQKGREVTEIDRDRERERENVQSVKENDKMRERGGREGEKRRRQREDSKGSC